MSFLHVTTGFPHPYKFSFEKRNKEYYLTMIENFGNICWVPIYSLTSDWHMIGNSNLRGNYLWQKNGRLIYMQSFFCERKVRKAYEIN